MAMRNAIDLQNCGWARYMDRVCGDLKKTCTWAKFDEVDGDARCDRLTKFEVELDIWIKCALGFPLGVGPRV